MSYTIVIDEQARERCFENRINETFRHCRIGGVMRKFQILGGKMVAPRSWYPDPVRPPPTPVFSGGYVHTTTSDDIPIVPLHGVTM